MIAYFDKEYELYLKKVLGKYISQKKVISVENCIKYTKEVRNAYHSPSFVRGAASGTYDCLFLIKTLNIKINHNPLMQWMVYIHAKVTGAKGTDA
jgi:hypothetical protein